jgi:hypothetical protein
LKKSLYGLKQSPLLWYKELEKVLLAAGYRKSKVDEALFYKDTAEGQRVWLLVYVDDLLGVSKSKEGLEELKGLLGQAFNLREIAPVECYLSLQIHRNRDRGTILVNQPAYVEKLKRRYFKGETPKWQPRTPLTVDEFGKLTFEQHARRTMTEYQQKVGVLQYAASTIRPDLSFACSILASATHVRADVHWRELDRALAYLCSTPSVGIMFRQKDEGEQLYGYNDADDAGSKVDRRTTGGYAFVFAGGVISWQAKKLRCVALSSAESEYLSAVEAGKEARKLRFLMCELKQLRENTPTILWTDNKAAIAISLAAQLTGKSKHMDRRCAWLQEMVQRRKLLLQYVSTLEQAADFLTKPLHRPQIEACGGKLGMKGLKKETETGTPITKSTQRMRGSVETCTSTV